MHPPRILVLATILVALVAGCTPAAAPTPSPTPTVPQCTPEFGGDPFPCTQADHDAMMARQAQYAEAERVYREYSSLNAQELVDRREAPSDELLGLMAGDRAKYQAELRANALSAATFSGAPEVAWLRPTPSTTPAGPLAMHVCLDTHDWLVSFNDGSQGPQERRVDLVHFDTALETPRIADVALAEDQSC